MPFLLGPRGAEETVYEDRDQRGKRLSTVLGRFIDSSGRLDYEAVSEDAGIAEFVDGLKDYDLKTLKTREAQLAFWINAYNMISIYGVIAQLRKDPSFAESGNQGVLRRIRFFFRRKYEIGRGQYSLNEIERKLRRELKEPRVHFALVCGAESCPPLKGGLYSKEAIDRELDAAAKIFINGPKGAVLDEDANIIRLSRIFKWFRRDFGDSQDAVLKFIARYHEDGNNIAARADKLTVRYFDYDWSLNQS